MQDPREEFRRLGALRAAFEHLSANLIADFIEDARGPETIPARLGRRLAHSASPVAIAAAGRR